MCIWHRIIHPNPTKQVLDIFLRACHKHYFCGRLYGKSSFNEIACKDFINEEKRLEMSLTMTKHNQVCCRFLSISSFQEQHNKLKFRKQQRWHLFRWNWFLRRIDQLHIRNFVNCKLQINNVTVFNRTK